MVNTPPRMMGGTFSAQTQTAAQAAPTAEQRIKTLEDQVAILMNLIKINGNHVEIKNTSGRIDIKANKIDLSGSGPGGVTSHNVRIARKGDLVRGTSTGAPHFHPNVNCTIV